MKKVLILLCLAAFVFTAKAQTDSARLEANVNKKTSIQKEEYCLVNVIQRSFSKKFLINVDYGNIEQGEDLTLKDEEDRPILVKSVADGLNYMAKQGWSLVSVTSHPSSADGYVMRRLLNQ